MDKIPVDILKEFAIPHVALTTFKYRATASNIIKHVKSNITIDQFVTLKILMTSAGICQQDFAQMIYKDKSNFSRMVDDLEKKGLIERKLDTKDKRVIKKLYITQKGVEATEKTTPIAALIHNTALKGIDPKEIEIMKKVLAKMRDNIDEINIKEL